MPLQTWQPCLPSLLKCYDQIVDGTRNILDLALMTGANRFLLTSSVHLWCAAC